MLSRIHRPHRMSFPTIPILLAVLVAASTAGRAEGAEIPPEPALLIGHLVESYTLPIQSVNAYFEVIQASAQEQYTLRIFELEGSGSLINPMPVAVTTISVDSFALLPGQIWAETVALNQAITTATGPLLFALEITLDHLEVGEILPVLESVTDCVEYGPCAYISEDLGVTWVSSDIYDDLTKVKIHVRPN